MNIFNISINKLDRFFYSIVFIVCFFLFVLISVFLFNNFYKIIIQTEEVLVLRKEVAIEDININEFNAVVENFEAKTRDRTLRVNIDF